MHSYNALYYPFIHFRDDSWVKLSALYWNKLNRIVPHSYATSDSETVKALAPCIENIRPDWVRPEFGDHFAKFILEFSPQLRRKYGLELLDSWQSVSAERLPPPAGGASGTDARLSYVFFEKLRGELLRLLIDSRLAVADQQDPRWIGMHPELTRVYMTAFAEQVAGERGLNLLTDVVTDHVAAGGWTMERLAEVLLGESLQATTQHEVESATAFVAFRTVLPAHIDQIPAERILEFRAKHLKDLGAFQTYLSGFVEKRPWLSEIEDRFMLERRIQEEYEREVLPKMNDLRAKLHDSGIDTINSVLSIQVATPWFVTKGAAFFGVAAAANPVAAAAAGIAGAAIALAKVARDRRKGQNEALKSSPVTYLHSMERDLAPATVAGRLSARARQLFGA